MADWNTADEYFAKLYSEQRPATPGEIAGVKAQTKGIKGLLHPIRRHKVKNAKQFTTYANDESKPITDVGDGFKDLGFSEEHFKRVKGKGQGEIL